MITYTWYTGSTPDDVDELRAMLAAAAAEDQEAGFPEVTATDADIPGARHLLVWLVPDERPGGAGPGDATRTLAGYLRLEVDDDGAGVVWFVVRPRLRSRGIATMLFEQLGLDVRAADGWAGTGAHTLRTWARGNHPAAARMSRRFHRWQVRRTLREWQLLMPLRVGRAVGPPTQVRAFDETTDGPALRELRSAAGTAAGMPSRDGYLFVAAEGDAVHGAVSVDPDAAQHTDYGVAGRITEVLLDEAHTEGPTRTRLLTAGLELLRDKGLRVAAITLDSRDERLVRDCRLLGFMHDRTDCLYQVY